MRVLALTLLAALGAVPGSALAAPPKLAVRVQQADTQSGSFFTLRAKPGQRASAGTIVVLNRDNKAITVDVDPVDAMTANNFASAYEVRAERKAGPTLWTRLSARRVTIAPKGRARVQVRAAIPRGVEGGEYLSGVAIEARGQRDSTPADKQVAVSVAQRFAVGFQVNVPGQREPKVALSGARIERKPAGVTFLVGAHNTGNVILKGVQGRLQVDSADGKRVLVQKLGPGTFVSGTKIDVSALAERARPQAGDKFRVRAELRYPGGVARLDENVTFGRKAAQAQEEFGGPRAGGGIPSWLWALIAAAVLVGAAAAARRIAVRRRRPLTREAALRLLTDEHDHARASGEPLSVATVASAAVAGADRAGVAKGIQQRLPGNFKLADLGDGFLVIAPDTGERGIAGLAEDLERSMATGNPGESASGVGTATARDSETQEQLLRRSQPVA